MSAASLARAGPADRAGSICGLRGQVAHPELAGGGQDVVLSSDCRSVETRAYPGAAWGHSPSLSDPTGAQSSQSSTMPVTLCKAMYFSAVMKVPSSRGSCTSRSHPHFSHASSIHWRGSEIVVMPASSQPAAAYPFGRTGQITQRRICISRKDLHRVGCHVPYASFVSCRESTSCLLDRVRPVHSLPVPAHLPIRMARDVMVRIWLRRTCPVTGSGCSPAGPPPRTSRS
jgi:hypothetical protein